MFFKKPILTKVAQTAEGVEAQIDAFLKNEGFENTFDLKELASSMLQHESGATGDTFDPKQLAAAMRRMIFNGHLFDIIQKTKAARKAEQAAKLEAKQQETATSVTPETTIVKN